MHERYAEYLRMVELEESAEVEALEITRKLREQFKIGEDGKALQTPRTADLALEAKAWATVFALRSARNYWMAQAGFSRNK